MKTFLKENWFRIGILFILALFTLTMSLFLVNKNKLAELERLDNLRKEEELKKAQELKSIEANNIKELENTVREKQDNLLKDNNNRITSQIIQFEEILEDKIVPLDIDCSVLSGFKYMYSLSPEVVARLYSSLDIESDFPRIKYKEVEDKCRAKWVNVMFLKNRMVAEPELKSLRQSIVNYLDSVTELAEYALGDGPFYDRSGTSEDKLRMFAREELLRMQRKYNLQPKFSSPN